MPFNIPHYPEQALERFTEMYKDTKDEARRSYGAMISTTDHYIGQSRRNEMSLTSFV